MMLSLGIREEQIQLYDLPMSKDRDGALEAYEIVAREACEKQKVEPSARIAIVAEGDCGFYSSSAYIGEHIEQEGFTTGADLRSTCLHRLQWPPRWSACAARGAVVLSSQAKLLVRSGIVLGRAVIPRRDEGLAL